MDMGIWDGDMGIYLFNVCGQVGRGGGGVRSAFLMPQLMLKQLGLLCFIILIWVGFATV